MSDVAISPPINVANAANPMVFFQCNYQTETGGTDFDQRWFRVTNTNGILAVAKMSGVTGP